MPILCLPRLFHLGASQKQIDTQKHAYSSTSRRKSNGNIDIDDILCAKYVSRLMVTY